MDLAITEGHNYNVCMTYLLMCLVFIGVKYSVSSDSACSPRLLAAKRSELRTSGVLDSSGAKSFLQKVKKKKNMLWNIRIANRCHLCL